MGTLKIVKSEFYEPDEELRQWFDQYCKDHPNLPTSVLERDDHIGFSKTGLDAYREGKYFLPKDSGGIYENPPKSSRIEDKIRAYQSKVEGITIGGVKRSFIETRMWQQFKYLCKTSIEEKTIVLGYGRPGIGKSRAIREYKREKMMTMPIEILCSPNITSRYFVQKIAMELGLNDRLPTARLEDLIADKLNGKRGTERVIFVDQANYLNERGLGTICYLWEKTQIPIVLLGTKDLFDLFMKSSLTEDVRVQLSSRISWHCEFVGLHLDEVKSIVFKMLGRYATNKVAAQIFSLTGGVLEQSGETKVGSNHRQLDMLLPRVLAIAEKRKNELQKQEVSMEQLIDKSWRKLIVM